MVDLVGTRTELRRAGANRYEGLCPFHDERTPSFGDRPGARSSTTASAAARAATRSTFVQQTEGLRLHGRARVPRRPLRRRARAGRGGPGDGRRAAASASGCSSCWSAPRRSTCATSGSPARPRPRASTSPRAGSTRRCCASSASATRRRRWDTLLLASRRAGFSNREIYDAGLAQRGEGRGHALRPLPAADHVPAVRPRGRVLGFGARALGADQKPKYLNSSEGDVYHKGRNALRRRTSRARRPTKAGSVIVAEGYTDVIAMHQAGLRNTVGLMGTALTEEQVGELARLAPTVLLALDADGAGQEAMLRAARVAAGPQARAARRPAAGGHGPGRPRRGRGRARRCSGSSTRRCRSCASASSASSSTGDLASAPRARTRVIDALRPVFAPDPAERAARGADRARGRPDRTCRRRSSARGWRRGRGRGRRAAAGGGARAARRATTKRHRGPPRGLRGRSTRSSRPSRSFSSRVSRRRRRGPAPSPRWTSRPCSRTT